MDDDIWTGRPSVLLIHSSASSGRQWQSLSELLEMEFNIVAPDLHGYGSLSDAADSTGFQDDLALVKDVVGQCESEVHLVGHSNGGAIAIQTALARPDLLRSLTLYEPAAFHFLANSDFSGRRLHLEIRQLAGIMTASAAMGEPFDAMKMFIDFWNGDGAWDRLASRSRSALANQVTSVMRDFNEGLGQSWLPGELKKIEAPTLIMTGLESPQIAQRAAIEIADAIPRARIALLPELGHMAPVFHPQWVNPRIYEHIANAERPARTFSWPVRHAA